MKRLFVLLALAVLVAALFSPLPAAAQVEQPMLHLSPDPGAIPVQPIEIPPDDIEHFWAHIDWPGHENEALHIAEVSWHWWSDPPDGANSTPIQWMVEPSQMVQVSQWFPWNVVHTVGRPSTLVYFQADVVFHDASGVDRGPIWSNIVVKHITPEPSSLAAFGLGAASLGGVLWRRRTK